MKRRETFTGQIVENSKIDAFLEDIAKVCHQHGLCLGHYDDINGFEVGQFDQQIVDAMMRADDATKLSGAIK